MTSHFQARLFIRGNMNIPEQVIVVLGIGAMLKETYNIAFRGSVKNIGSLVTAIYITAVYTALLIPGLIQHGGPFVRVGILLILLDKCLVFTYDLKMDHGKRLFKLLGIIR
jgi:hypothetical protein